MALERRGSILANRAFWRLAKAAPPQQLPQKHCTPASLCPISAADCARLFSSCSGSWERNLGMREQSGVSASSVLYSLPVDSRSQGLCSVQPGLLHLRHGQMVWVKMWLITPSATIQVTGPSGIFFPDEAVPCVVTRHFAASHSYCVKSWKVCCG